MIVEVELDLSPDVDPDRLGVAVMVQVEIEFEESLGPIGTIRWSAEARSSNIEEVIERAQFQLGHQLREAFDRKTRPENLDLPEVEYAVEAAA